MSEDAAKKNENLSLDDSDVSSGSIKLVSKDGREFSLDKKNAFISNLVKTSLDTDNTATEVPMPGVKGEILVKVVDYMNYHKVIILHCYLCKRFLAV
jgi:hypothetical protein